MSALYQGDCLKALPLVPDASVALIYTDLPFGTTACHWDTPIPLKPLWAEYKRVLRPGGVIALNAAQPFTSLLVVSNLAWFKHEWIWRKHRATGHLDCKKRPLREHESVVVFSEGAHLYNPQMQIGKRHIRGSGGPGPSDVWGKFNHSKVTASTEYYPKSILEFDCVLVPEHPTQKPVALAEYFIRTYTNEGDTVLDSCMGSGTTGVACLRTRREFIGIEQDREYYRLGCERIEETERDLAFRLFHPAEAIK